MANWIELFSSEAAGTVEGLTGQRPEVTFKTKESASDTSSIVAPMAIIEVEVSGDMSGKMVVAMPPAIGTALSDMMLGGEGESKEDMDDGDKDAVKEIVSNIFGALSTTMKAQKDLPDLSFKVDDIKFYASGEDIPLSGYNQLLTFQFSLGVVNGNFMLLLDDGVIKLIDDGSTAQQASSAGGSEGLPPEIHDLDMKNINLILDVKLPLKVRIGSKRMLLKDVLSMDIGSVVELDQLANDPLEVLVDDKVVAFGEVVIVDGNFGVQITHIGSKRETLEKLKG